MKFLLLLSLILISDADAAVAASGAASAAIAKVAAAIPTITGNKLTKVRIAFDAEVPKEKFVTLKLTGVTGSTFDFTATPSATTTTTAVIQEIKFECDVATKNSKFYFGTLAKTAAAGITDTTNVGYRAVVAAKVITIDLLNGGTTNPSADWAVDAGTECVFEIEFKTAYQLDVDATKTVDATNMQVVSSAAIKAATGTQKCAGAGSDATTQPVMSEACFNPVTTVVAGAIEVSPKEYQLGTFKVTQTTAHGTGSEPGTTVQCADANALNYVANCYVGGAQAYTDVMMVSSSVDLFEKGLTLCTGGGTSTKLMNCIDAKYCNMHIDYSATVTDVTCANPVKYGVNSSNTKIFIKKYSVYSGQGAFVPGTTKAADPVAPNVTGIVQYAFEKTGSNIYYQTLDTKLDALKADVAKIPTTVANSSASIVPLFLLGVFGSVFALTM